MAQFKPFKKIKFGTQEIKFNPEYEEDPGSPELLPKKKKSKRKDRDDDVFQTRSVPKGADLDDVDYTTWRRAMVIKAHNILDDEGVEEAKDFIKKNKLQYKIDEDNSNEYGMVVKDEVSGATELVMRGTNINLLKNGAKYLKQKIEESSGPVELKGGVGGMLFDPNAESGGYDLVNPKPAFKSTRGPKAITPEEMEELYRRPTPDEGGIEMQDFTPMKVPSKGVGGMLFDPNVEYGNFDMGRTIPRPKYLSPEEMEQMYEQPTPADESGVEMTGMPREARRLAEDLATDVDILTASGQSTNSFKESEKILTDNPDISRIIGYSKGGGVGMILGEKYGLDTTTFNPAVGKGLWDMMRDNAGMDIGDRPIHDVFKTTDDFASSWLDVMDNVGRTPNVDIKTVRSLDRSIIPGKDALNSHSLDQFTSRGKPRGEPLSHKMAQDLHADTHNFADMMADKSIDEFDPQDGDTFEDYWNDYSGRAFGTEGSGVSKASPHARAWERRGLPFTDDELDHLDDNWVKNGSPDLLPKSYTQKEYDNFDPVEHAKRLKSKQEAFDEESGLKQATTRSGFREGVSEGLSPSNVGKGLLGGIVGNTVMKAIDPDGKAGLVGDTAGSGAIAGLVAGGAGEILPGAAGAVIGVEASRGISSGLKSLGASKDVSQAGGDVGGGAIGGLGTVGTGALIAGEGLTIASGGTALAVGAAIGLGAYVWNKFDVGSEIEKAGKSAGDWFKRTF